MASAGPAHFIENDTASAAPAPFIPESCDSHGGLAYQLEVSANQSTDQEPTDTILQRNQEPSAHDAKLHQRFMALANEWKKETRFLSNVTTKAMHPAYQKIIGMGEVVVPLILADLNENGPDDWFWALHVITDANPMSDEVAGNMTAMTEAWLTWGRAAGYLSS